MVMSFSNQTALNYLLSNKFVYTFRKHKRKRVGKNWINAGRTLPKIADVNIRFIREVTNEMDLFAYAKDSGFNTLIRWIFAIESFLLLKHRMVKPVEGYLYKVELASTIFNIDNGWIKE